MALQASYSTEKGFPFVNNTNNKAVTESCMPILEQLQVKGWDSLEVLFLLKQNQQHSDTNTVNCLLKLIMTQQQQVPTSPIGVATTFNNLTLLSLDSCHRLRYVFSYSIVKLLVKLQEIKVSNCKGVEQLVHRELGEKGLTLTTPFLAQSSNSSSSDIHATIFSKEACALEWPALKRISIIHCTMLEVVISKTDFITSFAQLQSLILSHLPNLVSFCFPPCASEQPCLENCHGSSYQKQDKVCNLLLTNILLLKLHL